MSSILPAKRLFECHKSNFQPTCSGTVFLFKPHDAGGKSGRLSHPSATTCRMFGWNT